MDKSRLSLPLAEWAALNNHYHLQSQSNGASNSIFGSSITGSTTEELTIAPGGEIVATPCTPGEPMTHYHHKNDDHYCAAFSRMNRMRINAQVSLTVLL
jgi:hypothetical protein